MSESVKQKILEAGNNFNNLSFNKKALIGLSVSIGAAALISTAVLINKTDYKTAWTDLDSAAIQSIIPILESEQIPFKVGPNQSSILVDGNQIEKASVALLKSGIPNSPVEGYGLLANQKSPYMTKSSEKQLSRQIMEENIALSIMKLDNIDNAVVRLAISENSEFLRDVDPASASVVVTIAKGMELTKGQVKAISKLVSNSVSNLNVADIVILNQFGDLLSSEGGDNVGDISTKEKFKQSIERNLELKITRILAPIYGADSIRINVETDINFDQIETTTEAPVLDTVVLSEQGETSYDPNMTGGSGVPGALSNQPPEHAEFSNSKTSASAEEVENGLTHKRSTINYSVGKSITHTKKESGVIQGTKVAVIIDEQQTGKIQLEDLTTLIENSIGLNANEAETDSVNIVFAEFLKPIESAPEETAFIDTKIAHDSIQFLKYLLLIIAGYLLIMRPVLKSLTNDEKTNTLAGGDALSETSGDLDGEEELLKDNHESYEEKFTRNLEQVLLTIEQSPEVAATVAKYIVEDGNSIEHDGDELNDSPDDIKQEQEQEQEQETSPTQNKE